jgi:hypothetical protein
LIDALGEIDPHSDGVQGCFSDRPHGVPPIAGQDISCFGVTCQS